MKTVLPVLFCALIAANCGIVTARPPMMKPSVAVSVTVALDALQTILTANDATPPAVLLGLQDAQRAIAQDLSGATWGDLIRQALTTVYSQLPPAVQANPNVAALISGIEAALATVGA